MNKINFIISGVIALVVALIVVLSSAPSQGPQGPAGRDGLSTGNASGNSRIGPGDTVNGVVSWSLSAGFAATSTTNGTTTPCSGGAVGNFAGASYGGMTSPNATSTLRYTSFLSSATATALTIDLATSTSASPFATTTLKHSFSLPANVPGNYVWAPTTTENMIFAPNTPIVWGVRGNTGSTGVSANFQCKAEFRLL